jgi:hypothetical protein
VNLLLARDNTTFLPGHHGSRAALVGIGRVDQVAHDGVDLLVGGQLGTEGRGLSRAQDLHRGRGEQLAVLAEQSRVDGNIGRVGARAEVNQRVVQGVGRGDGDGAAAERLEVVDQRGVGGAPVDGADSDIVAGKLLQEGRALGDVALENRLVDVGGERIGRVASLCCVDDCLVRRGRLLQRERADVAADAADERVGAPLARVVTSALLGLEGGVGEERIEVGFSIGSD